MSFNWGGDLYLSVIFHHRVGPWQGRAYSPNVGMYQLSAPHVICIGCGRIPVANWYLPIIGHAYGDVLYQIATKLKQDNHKIPINTKAYIFHCSRKNKIPNIQELQQKIKYSISEEHMVSKLRIKEPLFQKRWHLWERIVENI